MKLRMLLVTAALLTSSACYIFGFLHQTQDRLYTGIRSLNASDYNQNTSWVDQSRQGHFLLENKFTADPQTGLFVRPVYFVLSQPFRLIPISNTVVIVILRAMCAVVLLALLFPIFGRFTKDEAIVRRAFLLIAFTAGLGILFKKSVDVTVPESILFVSLGEVPHFIYCQLLLWVGIASIYSGRPALYFVCLLILWWEHPFEAVILVAVAFANLWILNDRKKQILTIVITAGVSLPPYLYYQHLKKTPAFSGWGSAQNLMVSPGILSVISGYLPLLLLAMAGLFYLATGKEQAKLIRFLLIWIFVQFVLMYLPFPFQRRLIAGLQFPLALLAAYGIRNVKKLTLAVLILLLSSTNISSVVQWIRELAPGQMPYYMSRDYHDAFEWLSKQSDRDAVVLSGFVTGNFIPGFSGLTAYMGHSSLTPQIAKKKQAALEFYQNPNMGFLLKNRIQFIFYGLEERRMTNLLLADRFEIAYKNREVMILLPRPASNSRGIAQN